jgi:hypothetical protein
MGEGDDYPCPDCGQYIFKSTYRYNRKGWALKLNVNDGDGGKHGDPHRCPKRPSKYQKDFKDMRKCEQCNAMYNLDTYPMCPTCFKLVCSQCDHIWVATRFNVFEKHGPYNLVRRCPQCGHANPQLVFDKAGCEKMRAVVAINSSEDRA